MNFTLQIIYVVFNIHLFGIKPILPVYWILPKHMDAKTINYYIYVDRMTSDYLFLVTYDKRPSFDKSLRYLYVTFQYKHWDKEHPHGTLTQNDW